MRTQLLAVATLSFSTWAFCSANPTTHLQTLSAKFPHGLIGDDYGILTLNDLAINTCQAKAVPFPPEPYISAYQYWQCLETRQISAFCGGTRIPDPQEGVIGQVTLEINTQHGRHHYFDPHSWQIADCVVRPALLSSGCLEHALAGVQGAIRGTPKKSAAGVERDWN